MNSLIKKGRFTLSVLESTNQFTLTQHFAGEKIVSGDEIRDAQDIIQIMRAYIELTKTNHDHLRHSKR